MPIEGVFEMLATFQSQSKRKGERKWPIFGVNQLLVRQGKQAGGYTRCSVTL